MRKQHRTYVLHECPFCKKVFSVRKDCLNKKNPQESCGCIVTKHGMYKSRLYRIWCDMRTRCTCIKHRSYERYGGRGISVCSEWQWFIPFMEWALVNGYKPHLTIDRRDNNKGYSPDNCRWATYSEQELNKKKTGEEGVSFISKCKRWWSRIKRNGKSTTIGYFKTKEEAIKARLEYRINNNIL